MSGNVVPLRRRQLAGQAVSSIDVGALQLAAERPLREPQVMSELGHALAARAGRLDRLHPECRRVA